jgi:hypothetical protein
MLVGFGLLAIPPAVAQMDSPNQPEAIQPGKARTATPCRRLGRPDTIQPLRIEPQQVPAKNRAGCLSPEDAVYGSDGCPIRFCGPRTPRLQLPAP